MDVACNTDPLAYSSYGYYLVREVLGTEGIDAVRTELDNLADGRPARQMVYKDCAHFEVYLASE